MATLTPRLGAPYDQITSPHLRSASFERLDKDRFVKAYIQSQKQHTTTYAAGGKALVSSWDYRTLGTPTKQKQPTHLSKQYGFDTPVLRARVANPPDASVTVEDRTFDVDNRESEPAKVKPRKPSIPSINPKEFSSKSKKENVPPESKNPKTRPASKKRPIPTDSDDDEHTARLTERRERKRAKRAIVHPKELEDDENENCSPLPEKKTKKAKKSKIPAGLALMHGFIATNVGKNRLTLKPGLGAGVFGKGKASVKTQVVKTKSKTEHNAFSEFAFLNKPAKDERKQNQTQLNSPSSQSEHSLTSVSNLPTPKLKKIIITNREPSKARKSSATTSHRQNCVDSTAAQESCDVVDKSKETAGNSESEVWDMELDYLNTTHVSYSASSAGDHPQNGTVVLDTRVIWAGVQPGLAIGGRNVGDHQRIPRGYRDETDLAFAIEESGCHHSSSLCPSDSASQYGQPRILDLQTLDVPGPQATSKYFVNEKRVVNMAEKLEVPLRVGAKEILSQSHYHPAIPLDKAMGTLPVVPSAQSLVTAISNGYQPSRKLVASPSSLDSIEIELREYMDHVIGNADEVAVHFEYPGAIPGPESDVFEAHSDFHDQDESSTGDLQAWRPGGYEHMDVYRDEPIYPSDLDAYDGLEVEQDTWNGTDNGNDMAGFDFDEEEMQDEDDLDDSEYGSFYDPFEGIRNDVTARQDANSSSQASETATSVDVDVGPVLLTQRFSQGRAILLGISEPGITTMERSSKPVETVSHAEAVVAKSLREHWLPQKF
ncbi:hypothetical protein PILCRDRAFT_811175 [Piloderma croceum F 1598]|uniref:Uncharacterized protein n=1 Tax=Piloderma croceum (strain F 1598) TaxID=765440 RepID=A0A0C3G372_PILCF|nr:hypothetical protein PILCRDRAFT_811175 [Piloderma croceum F 1598]